MSNHRLPAGQAMPGGGPHQHGVNMGGRQGRSPRQPSQYHPAQQYHHQQPINQMYAGYNPYAHNPYAYSPNGMPPAYSNGAMHSPQQYMPYPQQQYNRQPPAMPQQQYAPPLVVGSHHHMAHPSYSGHHSQTQSPIVSAPFQPPPPAMPAMHTPAPESIPIQKPVIASSPMPTGPIPSAPPTPATVDQADAMNVVDTVEPPQQVPSPSQSDVEPAEPPRPFRAPLPWYSRPDSPFPTKTTKSKRRRRISDSEVIRGPTAEQEAPEDFPETTADVTEPNTNQEEEIASAVTPKSSLAVPAVDAPVAQSEAPSTPQDVSSEYAASTSPTTPTSVQHAQQSNTVTPTLPQPSKPMPRPVPALPVLPAVPKANSKDVRPSTAEKLEAVEKPAEKVAAETTKEADGGPAPIPNGVAAETDSTAEATLAPPPVRAPPKSWADMAKPTPSRAVAARSQQNGVNGAAGINATGSGADGAGKGGFAKSNSTSLAEALQAYRVGAGEKIAFVEPRGLVNTGNMCYMNSVLQVLLFCIPFYDFLDQASKKVAHSFGNSEAPLIDAMINLFQQFKVIDSAASADQLRRRLKREELEQYGAPFTPEFVYEAIKKLPRFDSMQRGHQQDAEEFLGFLLLALHEECEAVMPAAPGSNVSTEPNSAIPTPTSSRASTVAEATDTSNEWYEVGKRQRPAVTRSSGQVLVSTPVSKIFGGQLRHVTQIRGQIPSVMSEPYQPLQLDIGAPDVRNIVDALKGLTRTETLHGVVNNKGEIVTAQKQIQIDSLPPILILHLKRFQFDTEGHGTVKIWKKVGYPLELDIPREVLAPSRRTETGLPKYKLTGVVYHHGKNATTGHYTVDVRRQDDREWIRLDDTVIRRVRSEDVVDGGAEEGPAKARDTRKDGTNTVPSNRFAAMGDADGTDSEEGWNKVNSSVNGGKKWSSVVNGNSSGTNTPKGKPSPKDNIKDNKVAYILFYQRV